jgi:hypothetical protein
MFEKSPRGVEGEGKENVWRFGPGGPERTSHGTSSSLSLLSAHPLLKNHFRVPAMSFLRASSALRAARTTAPRRFASTASPSQVAQSAKQSATSAASSAKTAAEGAAGSAKAAAEGAAGSAQAKASDFAAQAMEYGNKALAAGQKALGPLGERVGNALGGKFHLRWSLLLPPFGDQVLAHSSLFWFMVGSGNVR